MAGSPEVLLIYPRPSPDSPQKNPALSIFYPGEAAAREGFEVSYWDERFDQTSDLPPLLDRVRLVAISSLSGFQLSRTVDIARDVRRRHPDLPIVLGGVHATFLPEQSLREPFVDYVVMGEGEDPFPALLRVLLRGEGSLAAIPGIGYQRDGSVVCQPRVATFDVKNRYVSPVSERTRRYFAVSAARDEVILPSSRGCPWRCSFCSVPGQYLKKYKAIPFEHWKADIEAIHRIQPFRFIELEDENSAYFIKRMEQYAAVLQSLGVTYHLHLRADQLLDEALVKRLADTGCVRIHIGVESGSPRVLNEVLRKEEDIAAFPAAARLLAKHGIEAVYTYIIGNPTETRAEMLATLDLADRLYAVHGGHCRSTIYVLMPLPGTEIHEQARGHGWILPEDMAGWSTMSAAHNPLLPPEINDIYYVGGFHFNRNHKTRQNFPGLTRFAILPFEWAMRLRWRLRWFSGFAFERACIQRLLAWRSRANAGTLHRHAGWHLAFEGIRLTP